jgi:GTP cyclohydrolase FolE2
MLLFLFCISFADNTETSHSYSSSQKIMSLQRFRLGCNTARLLKPTAVKFVLTQAQKNPSFVKDIKGMCESHNVTLLQTTHTSFTSLVTPF